MCAQNSLHAQRLASAQVTRGISAGPIYALALKLCAQSDLGDQLLEFGAGSGNFIRMLQETSYSGAITGIDIMSRPDDLASHRIAWVVADLNQPVPLPDQKFTAILATEVIEHLENPRFIFREFFRLLRPGGTLIITIPNQESIRALLALVFGGHFVAFLSQSYPAHITALLRLDFERICRETGFETPQFYYTDSGGIPKLPSLTWQKASLGLCRGRLFSDNIALTVKKP